ncbi:MAG: hypothetical protein PHT07_03345 [Paludibacter sp.]|nr:hypothetical protein [Paludibacter sp.]
MKNREDKFDILIGKLQEQKPELNEAEALTNKIMFKIRNKPRRQGISFLKMIRVISSAAAILLLGLFIIQQNEDNTVATNNTLTHLNDYMINIDSICIQHQSNKQVDLLETYLCYMQQNSIKNKQLQSFTQSLTN